MDIGLHDYGIEDIEKFWENYRYNICHIVTVQKAIPWLRHRGVFSLDDEELVTNGYKTSVLRTGHMLDILSRRGRKGFNAILEHIEFEHPEHFQVFTGHKAREPSKEYQPAVNRSYRPTSITILKSLIEINQQLLASYQQQKCDRSRLDQSMIQLESQITAQSKELEMKNKQISELSQKHIEVTGQCRNMQLQLDRTRSELSQTIEECNHLRKMKDECLLKYNQVIASTEEKSYAEIRTIKERGSTRDQQRTKLQQEITILKQELEEYKSRTNQETRDQWYHEITAKHKTEIQKLTDENEKMKDEKEYMDELLEKLNEMSKHYEEKNSEYQGQLLMLQKERDEFNTKLAKKNDLCECLERRNEQLTRTLSHLNNKLKHIDDERNIFTSLPKVEDNLCDGERPYDTELTELPKSPTYDRLKTGYLKRNGVLIDGSEDMDFKNKNYTETRPVSPTRPPASSELTTDSNTFQSISTNNCTDKSSGRKGAVKHTNCMASGLS